MVDLMIPPRRLEFIADQCTRTSLNYSDSSSFIWDSKQKFTKIVIKRMNETIHHSPGFEARPSVRDQAPEPYKIHVTLLDEDDLPLARGTATLPLLLGVGVFWPSCPMPPSSQLASAKCFVLPTGETLRLKSMSLCAGTPPHYSFRVSTPAQVY